MCSKRGWRKPLLTLVGKLQTRMTSSSENILSLILSYRAAASRLLVWPRQMARYASPTIYHISKQRWAMGAAPLRPALIADV
jgi:hypothetical protein